MTDDFAKKAMDWDSPHKLNMASAFVSEIKKHLKLNSTQKALEIGAGTGLVGFMLLPNLSSIVFVDTSEAMLDVLRKKIQKDDSVEVVHGDVLAYHKKDIDLIVSNMAFHHIPDIEGLLDHLYTITSIGAKVVISDLVSEDGSFHNFEEVPHQGFDPKDLSGKFLKAGFKNIKAYEYNTLSREKEDGIMHHYNQFILFAEK